jgi:hypothetical protein
VRYSVDYWASAHDVDALDTTIGLWVVDIHADLEEGARIVFTILWADDSSWENRNFTVSISSAEAAPTP